MFDSEELLARILESFHGREGKPFMLELRPTNRCNLWCPSCVARGHPSQMPLGEELSLEEYMRIIDEAAEMGVRYVQVTGGGEPFLRKDMPEIMQRIKERGMSGLVVTNGTLFDLSTVHRIFGMGWDALLFSVDGHEAALNDTLRSKNGSFHRATGAIREFSRLKKAYGTNTPRLDIGPVLSHCNCRYICDLVRLGADLGADNVLFQPVRVPEIGAPLRLTPDDEKFLLEEIPKAVRFAEQLGIRTNLSQLDKDMIGKSSELPEVIRSYSSTYTHPWLSIHCFSPWYYLGINPDGTVGPCSIHDDLTYIHNVRGKSLQEIWKSEQFRAFRAGLAGGDLPRTCERCCGTNVLAIHKIREGLKQVISA